MRGKLEPHETERAPQGARFISSIERPGAVIPATELLATDGSCLPGPSDFAVHHCTTSMSSARLPGERATFVSAKVAKTISAGHDGLANIRLARLHCASRAKRAGANSHILVLKQSRLAPAWHCDARRHATAPEAHFDTAIHGLPIWCAMLCAIPAKIMKSRMGCNRRSAVATNNFCFRAQ